MQSRPHIAFAAAGCGVLAALALLLRQHDRLTCEPGLIVTNDSQLRNQIACAARQGGGTIKLGAGARLNKLSIRDAQFPKLLVVSADPRRPAIFDELEIVDSANIAVRTVRVSGIRIKDTPYAILVRGSRGVMLDNLDVDGVVSPPGSPHRSAVMVRNSQNVTINKSRFSNSTHAITLFDVTSASITGCFFSNLQIDGVRAGRVQNLLVQGNVFTAFHPADGDHPDAVQLWTRNETEPSRDIVIRHNIVLRGKGMPIQGIFLRDTNGLRFRNVEIAHNTLVGTMYAGIAVDGFENLRIRHNVLVPQAPYLTRIHIEAGENAIIAYNVAGKFLIEAPAILSGNGTVPIRDVPQTSRPLSAPAERPAR